jgi:hypothetical protein
VACGHPAEDEIRYLFWKFAIEVLVQAFKADEDHKEEKQ